MDILRSSPNRIRLHFLWQDCMKASQSKSSSPASFIFFANMASLLKFGGISRYVFMNCHWIRATVPFICQSFGKEREREVLVPKG